MSDTMTAEQRHKCMSHIRAKNTRPEVIVRQYLHAAGFRFRIHVKKLPGTPDIVLRKYHTVIFVNGCFWHGHHGCRYATRPKANADFWLDKIQNNIRRDELTAQTLEVMGWKVVTIWECELKNGIRDTSLPALAARIRENATLYAAEQEHRHRRNAEHRAMLKAAHDRYAAAMAELQSLTGDADIKGQIIESLYPHKRPIMKTIEVVAAVLKHNDLLYACQRGYGEQKDKWEFPGGKMEAGETPEDALIREIREELDTEISVDGFLCTVDWDYPTFHLTMHCYWCSVVSGHLELKEHEAARWLSLNELDSVDWLPADIITVNAIKDSLGS